MRVICLNKTQRDLGGITIPSDLMLAFLSIIPLHKHVPLLGHASARRLLIGIFALESTAWRSTLSIETKNRWT